MSFCANAASIAEMDAEALAMMGEDAELIAAMVMVRTGRGAERVSLGSTDAVDAEIAVVGSVETDDARRAPGVLSMAIPAGTAVGEGSKETDGARLGAGALSMGILAGTAVGEGSTDRPRLGAGALSTVAEDTSGDAVLEARAVTAVEPTVTPDVG